MNIRFLLLPLIATAALAQNQSAPMILDGQRLYGPASQGPAASDLATESAAKFRSAYGAGAAPRIIVYVNRALIEPAAPAPADSTTATGATAAKAPTIADQQTVREIEALFGKIFRSAGGMLVDQTFALGMPGPRQAGDTAAREREALSSAADIAIEVLISSRNLTVTAVSGDRVIAVPDIQTTAIRLKDSAIVGQASAANVLARNATNGALDVRSLTEATAFALMQDMLKTPAPAVAVK